MNPLEQLFKRLQVMTQDEYLFIDVDLYTFNQALQMIVPFSMWSLFKYQKSTVSISILDYPRVLESIENLNSVQEYGPIDLEFFSCWWRDRLKDLFICV